MAVIVIDQQSKARFLSLIELSNNISIFLCDVCIYDLFIANKSTNRPIQNVSNTNQSVENIMRRFYH